MPDELLALPPAIGAWLVGFVEDSWREPGPVVAALPSALPEGVVTRLASGGPFGLLLDGRLDRIDGRIALEALENSRMSGESYLRVWDDGTVQPLEPAPRTAFAGRDEEAYLAHNRAAYDHLRERGF